MSAGVVVGCCNLIGGVVEGGGDLTGEVGEGVTI
ncbi:hypothetical protein Barb7_01057 [Bacteroidales bacterium Barb7]|nr:hypothetical protein Barb7_01057 [Bacteroidales bacterium Barb7]